MWIIISHEIQDPHFSHQYNWCLLSTKPEYQASYLLATGNLVGGLLVHSVPPWPIFDEKNGVFAQLPQLREVHFPHWPPAIESRQPNRKPNLSANKIVVIKRTILGVYTSVLSVIWASFWTTSSYIKSVKLRTTCATSFSSSGLKNRFFQLKIRCTQRGARNQTSDSTNVMCQVLPCLKSSSFQTEKFRRMTEVLDMQSEHHHVTSLRKSQPEKRFTFKSIQIFQGWFWAIPPIPPKKSDGIFLLPKKYTPKKPVNTIWIRKISPNFCWVAQHDEIHPSGRRLAASPPWDPMVNLLGWLVEPTHQVGSWNQKGLGVMFFQRSFFVATT